MNVVDSDAFLDMPLSTQASQYSNIGVNKISSLLNEPGCSFLFCVGKGKRLVKRKEFEKFIEKTLEV